MRAWALADCPVMPWKNGAGSTTELAVFPPGAPLDGFDWRISSAAVAADGPFSLFEGIDRSLALLQGAPLELTLDGAETHSLALDSPPICFAGERAAAARLSAGPVVDLNLMTRRAKWSHQLLRLAGEDEYRFERSGDCLWLYCVGGAGELAFSEQSLHVQAGQMLMFDAADGYDEFMLRMEAGGVCFLAHLFSKD